MCNKSKDILVLEDEAQIRFYLMTLVKSMGYNPVLSKDGNEGLNKLKSINPACIVLDVMMPDKGGALVYQELVTKPEYRNIPIVFFSGVDREAFSHYIKMLNIKLEVEIPEPEYYVAKDADPEYLKSVILRSIERGSGIDEAG